MIRPILFITLFSVAHVLAVTTTNSDEMAGRNIASLIQEYMSNNEDNLPSGWRELYLYGDVNSVYTNPENDPTHTYSWLLDVVEINGIQTILVSSNPIDEKKYAHDGTGDYTVTGKFRYLIGLDEAGKAVVRKMKESAFQDVIKNLSVQVPKATPYNPGGKERMILVSLGDHWRQKGKVYHGAGIDLEEYIASHNAGDVETSYSPSKIDSSPKDPPAQTKVEDSAEEPEEISHRSGHCRTWLLIAVIGVVAIAVFFAYRKVFAKK